MSLPPPNHASRLTEQRNPASMQIDTASIPEILAIFHAEDRKCCDAAQAVAPSVAAAIELVVAAFKAGGRLIYIGAGTSGRLGVLDASEQTPTFNVSPEMVQGIMAGGWEALYTSIEDVEDSAPAGHAAIAEKAVGPNDVVFGMASGGRTPFVFGALREARERGAKTILLTCTPPLEGETHLADVQIHPLVGPEIVTGSTRMKAGTVTKLILNQVTTTSMIQLGKVYQNLMVDVQPANKKLVDRACRILKMVAGLEPEDALVALQAAGNDVKVALIMTLAGLTVDQARERLTEHNGHVARAIQSCIAGSAV